MSYQPNLIPDPSEKGFTDYDSERLKKVVNGINANFSAISTEIEAHEHSSAYAAKDHDHDEEYSQIDHVHNDLLVTEENAPDAPDSDKAIIFLSDNEGSSELKVKFSNGVVKTLATDVME